MVDFQKDLNDWLFNHRSITDEKLQIENITSDVFRDTNGILRYKDTWKVATQDQNNSIVFEKNRSIFMNENEKIQPSGCKQLLIDYSYSPFTIKNNNQDNSYQIKHIRLKFITDWKVLWKYIASDQEDEIALFCPLLKTYIEFFFHLQTRKILIAIGIYSLSANIAILIIYRPNVIALWYLFISVPLVGLSAYFIAYRLIRGSTNIVHHNNSTSNDNIIDDKKDGNSINHLTPHWNLALLQLYRSASTECKANCFCYNGRSKRPTHNHKSEEKESFYQLMNISLKYLTRVCELKIEDATFNRPIYKYFLQSITFGLPFLVIFIVCITNVSYLSVLCGDIPSNQLFQNQYCGIYLLEFILSFGYGLNMIFVYIYGSSVMLTLVALAYGAEIAYRLTDAWIDRFGSLRRISFPANDLNHSTVSINNSNNEINDMNSKIIDLNNNNLKSSLSSDKSTLNPLTSSKIKINEEVIEDQEDEESPVTPLIHNVHSVIDVIPYIERESFERYLFMRHYLNQASKIWSPLILALVGWFVFLGGAAGLTVAGGSFTTRRWNTDQFDFTVIYFVWFLFIRFVIVLVLPILSITHANSHVSLLTESFVDASPDDFSILGGRDKWIEFIKSVPAVWTIYGIWITYDKFYGVFSAFFISSLAYLLSYISN
eukprot:gene13007-17439_t